MNKSNNVLELTEIPNNLPSIAQRVAISSRSAHNKDAGGRIKTLQEHIKTLEKESSKETSTFIAGFTDTYNHMRRYVLRCASESSVCIISVRGVGSRDLLNSEARLNEWAFHYPATYAVFICLMSELEIKGWKSTLSAPVDGYHVDHPEVHFRCDFSTKNM